MKPVITVGNANVFHGSNLDVLPFMADNSVDSIVTDPPYELGFMGKSWDSTGIAYSVELWQECLRVLKPGGHLLAFGGSRTWHRLAVAIEDAGFEMRDSIAWLYGSGFPKSHNISIGIDKQAGAMKHRGVRFENSGLRRQGDEVPNPTGAPTHKAITPEAQQWQGWGTALKPAFEPVVVARKPLIGTVAANVLEWGVGGLNIDVSRIGMSAKDKEAYPKFTTRIGGSNNNWQNAEDENGKPIYDVPVQTPSGRWPANIILDEYTAGLLDEQSGQLTSGAVNPYTIKETNIDFNKGLAGKTKTWTGQANSGGASRFFKVADTQKHDTMSVCKNTPANIVANYFRTIRAIIESFAQITADTQPNEQLDQAVKSAGILCDSCATNIALDLAALKNLATNAATSPHFQRYTKDCANSTLSQNLASLVETWVNTGTIPTTTNFGKLFGCVLLATDENTRLESLVNGSAPTPFLYQAKASKRDRNEGLDHLDDGAIPYESHRANFENTKGVETPFAGAGRSGNNLKNFHPTVKPTDLMRYLIKLVTPAGGIVLDPFTGSGSTGKAALLDGYQFVGIELTNDYLPIIQGRLDWANKQFQAKPEGLF